ncbi:MAG: PHP domain-containing protein, partial [Pseudomonadota bacterium]
MSRPPENPPIPFKRPSHPTHDCQTVVPFKPNRDDGPAYAELHALTNFSFLRGASHPGEMVIQAKLLGHTAIGIADVNTLAGVVRAHAQAKKEGLKLLIGATLEFTGGVADGLSCVCYPTDRAAYGRLCKLLSDGKRRAPKGACHIRLEDVLVHAEGQVFIALPPVDMARHA